MAPILTKIAAQVDDGPCVTYIGPGGAGHYVKMVHNGIEYGDMQLIAEAYDLLQAASAASSNAELADVFDEWNRGELQSFLIEITAQHLPRQGSRRRGGDLVDLILDAAGDEGHRQVDGAGRRRARRAGPDHRRLGRGARALVATAQARAGGVEAAARPVAHAAAAGRQAGASSPTCAPRSTRRRRAPTRRG